MASSAALTLLWAEGDPQQLATWFAERMKKFPGGMGRKGYVAFVTAAACASVHQVLQSSAGTTTITKQLTNILLTAKTIADKAAKPDPALDDVDEDEDNEYEDDRFKPTALGQPWAEALTLLVKVVKTALDKGKQAIDTSAPAAGATSSMSGLAAVSSNSLPLPTAILQALMDKLDSRGAAAAAAACKSFRAAYIASRRFHVSEALRAYVECRQAATMATCEADFNLHWPLDGSAVCGHDLEGDSAGRMLRTLGEAGMVSQAEFRAKIEENCQDATSTPLSIFKQSKPVSFHTPTLTFVTPQPSTETATAAPSADAPAAASAHHIASAVCDIYELRGVHFGYPMHLDGDMLSVSYQHGWKQRDPGLAVTDLTQPLDDIGDVAYSHGFFNSITEVYSDSTNALVWAAADGGKRIKAFRAPDGIKPSNMDAACNRGDDNGLTVQYTFSTDVKGLHGDHAGLYVLGTKVIAVNGGGSLFTWDISDLPAQTHERPSGAALNQDDDDDDDDDDSDPEGGERFKGSTGWRDTEELEVTRGVMPHGIYQLQQAVNPPWNNLDRTCLLSDGGNISSQSRTLLAAYSGFGGGVIVAYDVETQKVKHQLLGHVSHIEDISPAPTCWPGSQHLFASCSRGGDVKYWDLRTKSASAAVTLGRGGTEPLSACVLAATDGAATASSSAGQLGAGMFCFAGGVCEAVWCWDLRGSRAQVLYELSTGNNRVVGLVWHEKSGTLWSSCDSMEPNSFGECFQVDFVRLGANGAVPYGSDDDEEAEDNDCDALWWPKLAKHNGDDFKRYFSMPQSCMIAYKFGPDASKQVPDSEQPYFSGTW